LIDDQVLAEEMKFILKPFGKGANCLNTLEFDHENQSLKLGRNSETGLDRPCEYIQHVSRSHVMMTYRHGKLFMDVICRQDGIVYVNGAVCERGEAKLHTGDKISLLGSIQFFNYQVQKVEASSTQELDLPKSKKQKTATDPPKQQQAQVITMLQSPVTTGRYQRPSRRTPPRSNNYNNNSGNANAAVDLIVDSTTISNNNNQNNNNNHNKNRNNNRSAVKAMEFPLNEPPETDEYPVDSFLSPVLLSPQSGKNNNNNQNNNNNHNKNRNNNRPSLKVMEVVRKKEERAALRGFPCDDCVAFYNAQIQQKIIDPNNLNDFLKLCSKHKAKYTPSSTPEGFWDLTMGEDPHEWKQQDLQRELSEWKK
jgi:hypothetical protein